MGDDFQLDRSIEGGIPFDDGSVDLGGLLEGEGFVDLDGNGAEDMG